MNRCLDCAYYKQSKKRHLCTNLEMARKYIIDYDFIFDPITGEHSDFRLSVDEVRNRGTENYIACKGFCEI